MNLQDVQWLELVTMKNKHLLSLFLLIVATCTFLWIFLSPLGELDYDMNSPRGYYTIGPPGQSLWQNLRRELVKDRLRGSAATTTSPQSGSASRQTFPGQFSDTPVGIVENSSRVIPAIGSLVHSANLAFLADFLDSVKEHVPYLTTVLYAMDLSDAAQEWLSLQCNTTNNCDWRPFPAEKFPFHVRNLETKAYKPIIIQDLLHEFGGCIWVDITSSTYVFVHSNITSVLLRARKVGLAAWTIREPTSALTHPKTLQYLGTRQDRYYFHRMIATSHLVLVNNAIIHEKVVRPWVDCALAERCIQPLGARNFGCNHSRKPLFRYSGCHAYEMSALNVILGEVFSFDARTYTVQDEVFGRLMGNMTETLNYHLSHHHLLR